MMRQRLNVLSIGVFAGFLAGILPGIIARIAMRVIALAAGHTAFHLLPTLMGIVLPGAIMGGLLGLFYLGIRDYLPGTNRLTKGIVFGALLFMLMGAPFFLLLIEFVNGVRLSPVLGRFLFFSLPFLYSLPLAYVLPWVEAKWSTVEGRITALEIIRYIACLVALAIAILFFTLFFSVILRDTAKIIGTPIRAWINGRTPDLTLQMLVGAILVLTYPVFYLLNLYLPLRRFLFGANWMRGLLIGVIVALVTGIVVFINVNTTTATSLMMRAPLTGLAVLLALLIISGAGIHLLQQTSNADGTLQIASLSPQTKTVIAAVTLSEAVLLLVSAFS